MRKNYPKRPFVAPNDLKWAKNGPKMTQNGPKMAQKKSPGAKMRKNCSLLSSIFDVEAPFQRYLRKSEILPILGRGRLRRASTLIFQNFCDETRSDFPGHQKNDPDLQRRRTLKRERKNGRFSVGPKIAKRAKRRWTRPKIFFRFRFRPFFVIFAKKSYPPSLWGSVCQ